jgi:hypothetical protein
MLCVLGTLLAWRGRFTPAESIAFVGALLIALALVAPALLIVPTDVWHRFSRVLEYLVARLVLALIFAIALVPVGSILRLIRKDPLARHFDKRSGWSPHPERYRNPRHYTRMF